MRIASICAFLMLTTLAAGCGQSHGPPADPDQAQTALKTALEAWKKGDRPASLESNSPPISFSDVNWDKGERLIDYKVLGSGPSGRQLRFTANLTLEDKEGTTREEEAAYIIDTGAKIVIVQEDI